MQIRSPAGSFAKAPATGRFKRVIRQALPPCSCGALLLGLLSPAPAFALPAVNVEAVTSNDVSPGWLDTTTPPVDVNSLRWGPLRSLTHASELAPRSMGSAGLFAYVNLGNSLPSHLRALFERADGGVTFELRSAGANSLVGTSMSSMLRWRMSDGGQLSLRLRAGKLGLQYGTRF